MVRQLFVRHFDYDRMVLILDLIVGHSGFGNTLHFKEVWPNANFLVILNGSTAAVDQMGFGNNSTTQP